MLHLKFLFVLIIINTIDAGYRPGRPHRNRNKNRDICMTRTCVLEAAKLLDTIDESVNPCNDFYEFSCGKWIENKLLPEHKSIVNRFSELQDELNDHIRDLIVKTDVRLEPREFVKNAKNYFDSCFNKSQLEELGEKPLNDMLVRLGGWPATIGLGLDWNTVDWVDMHGRLRELGLVNSMLFSLSISPDLKNNSRRILSLDHPTFGLGSRDILLKGVNDSAVIAYKNLIIKSAVKLGGIKYYVTYPVDEILRFETLLASNSMPKEERRNLTAIYNKMTIKELEVLTPNIKWLQIIQKFVSANISENEEIVVYDTDYIKFLDSYLPQYSNKLLSNYIIWRVIQTQLSSLNEEWYELKEEFDFAIYGTRSRTPRWEMCLKNTKSAMSIALSHLYIKHFFNDDNKDKALEMFKNIVNEFKRSLDVNSWMKIDTLDHGLKKLDNMKLLVGYPDELMDETRVTDYYETLWTNSTDYVGNNGRISKWYLDLAFSKLNEPVDQYDWRELSSVAVVNAYYHQLKNLVVMPAGILQGVFFNKERPNYLNYGSIGYVSGHEIIHGFDDGGRQYDAIGNLRNWWDEETDMIYTGKTRCFINQYGKFGVKEVDLPLNGINTQGENIADNGGISQAYRAYLRYVERNGPEPKLPAINYTQEQMFWISSAVQYCSKATDQFLKIQVMTDSHSPSRQRVNGALSNSEEFSRAFNCPLGAPMNPADKCVIW